MAHDPCQWLADRAREMGTQPALWRACAEDGEPLTYSQLWAECVELGDRMLRAGIRAGDRVAILSESRPRWAVALFAAWRAGAVVVPLDPLLEEPELAPLVRDCAPRLILASGAALERACAIARAASEPCAVHRLDDPGSIPELACRTGTPEFDFRAQLALIVYTSGTDGKPKGVMLTHANLRFQIESIRGLFRNDARTVCVSLLPLNHVFGLTVGLLAILHGAGRICYSKSLLPEDLAAAMREARPTVIIAVPLFLNLIKDGIERRIRNGAASRRVAFRVLHALARPIPWMRLRRLLFRSVHERFGGRIEYFVSGGAPLANIVGDFIRRLGFEVYQGYGLTETSPIVSANSPRANRPGSVGRPLPGVELRFVAPAEGEQSEIWTRGPHVMKGYFRQSGTSPDALSADGWFRTGDLGYLDADGFLHITGRRKNLLVLGSGKKVVPEEIERLLEGDPAIKEALVLSREARSRLRHGSEELCAVVVPSEQVLARVSNDTAGLEQALYESVRRCTKAVAAFKRPTRIVVRREDFPKTTTRKIKRALVRAWLDALEAA